MNTIITKTVLGIFLVNLVVASFGQCEKRWPDAPTDSAECVKHYSLFDSYYDQKNYKDANKFWRYVFNNCPCASKNIYIKGVRLYKKNIVNDRDNAMAHLDTVLLIYDQRVQYYPKDDCSVKAYKAVDIYNYLGKNISRTEEAYKLMKASVECKKHRSSNAMLNYFLKMSTDLKMAEKLSTEESFKDYLLAYDLLEKRKEILKKQEDKDQVDTVIITNDKIAIQSEILTRELLVPYLTEQYENCESSDINQVKRIVKLLAVIDANDEPLYEKALTCWIETEPTHNGYYILSKYKKNKKKFAEADKYLGKAIETAETDEAKAQYLVERARLNTEDLYNHPACRAYALQALKYRPDWAIPYMMIGKAYAASSSAIKDDCLGSVVVYWAAADKMQRAVNLAEDENVKKQASAYLGAYLARYPDSETAFMCNLNNGDTYTVGGWINENTIVRTK